MKGGCWFVGVTVFTSYTAYLYFHLMSVISSAGVRSLDPWIYDAILDGWLIWNYGAI